MKCHWCEAEIKGQPIRLNRAKHAYGWSAENQIKVFCNPSHFWEWVGAGCPQTAGESAYHDSSLVKSC